MVWQITMESYIVFLEPDKISLFEKNNQNEIVPFYYKGEEFIPITSVGLMEELENIKDYLLDRLNIHRFSQLSFIILYTFSIQIKSIPSAFFDCLEFELINIKTILPILFQPMQKQKSIGIGTQCWKVKADRSGHMMIESAKGNSKTEWLTPKKILETFYQQRSNLNHEDIMTEEKINQLLTESKKHKDNVRQLKKENKTLLQSIDVLSRQLEEQEMLNELYLPGFLQSERVIIRTPRSYSEVGNNRCLNIMKGNGEVAKKGEVIAQLIVPTDKRRKKIDIQALKAGKIFWFVSDNQKIKHDQTIAVIGNVRDTYEEAEKWFHEGER